MERTERRSAFRIPINVELEARRNGDVFKGTCVNVSESGILIQTSKNLNPGDQITIRLSSPGKEEIAGQGTVVRSEDFGFGKFSYAVHWQLSTAQSLALKEWINSVLKR